ncbi:hypothetical protein [Micromonospora thermarum]|uniref:Secreted protein n=1 Tax=Micromonospora thermarum TaxID=2720024 RepID=A0ABX0ZAN2_9ACTN|nr:hypothetical protein [Micromonospora thermarum]NJP34269.1 hypothetical protein [Micromonospora thermarum]
MRSILGRAVVAFAAVALTAIPACRGANDDDIAIGVSTAAPSSPTPTPTAVASPSDFTPTIAADQLRRGLPTAVALGAQWHGPTDQGTGFPDLGKFVQGCPQPGRLRTGHEETKPIRGALGSYLNADKSVVLNTVQVGLGVDTISRSMAYLAFLRTVPGGCTSGLLQGKYPMRMSLAPPRSLGDEEVNLRIAVDLPDRGTPLELENAFVRVGGLVVVFYGVPAQVDEYLSTALTSARQALTGGVPGL